MTQGFTQALSIPLAVAKGGLGNTGESGGTPNIVGVTDASNASAGSVGEFMSSIILVGSAVSMTTATAKDITSITLTAGDWDVWGNVFLAASGANIAAYYMWMDTTSNTRPALVYTSGESASTNNTNEAKCVPSRRYNVSGSTTVYLGADVTFASGTVTGFGAIYARRVR